MKAQADAPKTPAALAKANVAFAFTSGGSTAADFVRNAGRVIREGGLAADAVLRALTIDAARLAGAADRIGSIEKGKIANVVVTEGDLFDGGRVRHVFIDGRPIEITEAAPAAAGGRGGRGGTAVQGTESKVQAPGTGLELNLLIDPCLGQRCALPCPPIGTIYRK